MKKRHTSHRSCGNHNTPFKKSLVSYVLMLIFFGFLFVSTGVPSFVFFIIAIPMTIGIIHKYIDTQSNDEYSSHDEEDIYTADEELLDEEWEEEPLELDDMKTLRKEWKDSDFV